ncbi:hypothetical protein C7S16_6714 [Burkholderia thailandensis]|uniref:Uncharacterized protein n=1 Tax=Burkholderia thailandensis TaxID=57975 RepID=A0AAW9CXF6_BURTH|nr:hypothetical protein [Burkholderia thailandensis]MDW9253517.1 hypothetical protein [Burkholderia thailandensis]
MTSRCDARRIASRVVRRPPAASRAAAGAGRRWNVACARRDASGADATREPGAESERR